MTGVRYQLVEDINNLLIVERSYSVSTQVVHLLPEHMNRMDKHNGDCSPKASV